MDSFTPVSALVGGLLIGLAASALLLLTGRVAGISGVVAGVLVPRRGEWGWRVAFAAGLLAGGVALAMLAPARLGVPSRPYGVLAVAGLLVGFGARLGGGCTSGHGVCGLSRLSLRSLVATLTFMATGIASASLVRLLGGS